MSTHAQPAAESQPQRMSDLSRTGPQGHTPVVCRDFALRRLESTSEVGRVHQRQPSATRPVGVGTALGAALRDFWAHSWRLALLNAALSAAALAVAAAVAFSLLALALVPLLGIPAGALQHCTLVLARTGDLRLADAAVGLRRTWRRGLELGLLDAVVIGAGVFAIVAYASSSGTLAAAVAVAYLLAGFLLLQLHLWPLAVAAPEPSLLAAAREAFASMLARPGTTLGLGTTLLAVNLAGLAVGVMPFLTLTVAFSFLASAHFARGREN